MKHLKLAYTLLVAVVLVIGFSSWKQSQNATHDRQKAEVATARLDKVAGDVNALRAQVQSLGAIPVAPPATENGSASSAPSDAQVRTAVQSYIAAHPPASGQPPTAEEVFAAVAQFCGTGACKGATGTSGTSAGPSDAQLAAAVASYCAAHGCTGAPGPTGPQGVAGSPPASFSFDIHKQHFVCSPDSPPSPGSTPNYTCQEA